MADNGDIFQRATQKVGDVWAVDSARLTFGAEFGTGMVTQQFGWNYAQQMNMLYEIGTTNVYIVAGRTVGQAQGQRILGPNPVIVGFYRKYGNVCGIRTNMIKLDMSQNTCVPGADGLNVDRPGAKIDVSFNNVALMSIGGSIAAEQMMIGENFQMRFVSLEMKQAGGAA